MIDHISVGVRDYERSKKFYLEALRPLGYAIVKEYGKSGGLGERGAFVTDPDGHNVEAVCHKPE
jgi:catechol 2,3-dioxygenase-like lactoylglutathione lyase family enzyme